MTTERRKVSDYELIDHGIENPQYFQGCGTAFTDFEHCVTGIGDDAFEAIDDCLEQMATDGIDTEALETELAEEIRQHVLQSVQEYIAENAEPDDDDSGEPPDLYYHVSIRYNVAD